MALYLQTTSGPSAPPVVPAATKSRQTANYHPSIWGEKFLAYDSSTIVNTDAYCKVEDHNNMLKKEVKKLLTDKSQQQLMNLIDEIQRLGVAYHFEVEIDALLKQMNDSFQEYCQSKNENDLLEIALSFRLLRQQGHNVSSDVFNKFKDSNGKFKEELAKDVRGMLSFYEASYLRVNGEDILDQPLEFSTFHLNQHLNNSDHLSKPLKFQIARALKCPIRKSLTRLEARHYISIYDQFDTYNQVLFEFAKLDFNLVQKLHQGELGHISRWWKDLDFATKLPFARDRVVECYFWILGVYFEPQYAMARRFVTKVISLTSVIDDIFDVYGTLEELVPFTAAIERWDISALDDLPEYMKDCYKALIDVFTQMEEETAEAGKATHGFEYAKAAFKRLTRAYMKEAIWLNEGYVPGLEEHLSVSLVSAGYMMLSAASFVLMGDVATIEAFDWLSQDPLIVRASSLINRFTDDIVGHEEEQKRLHVVSGIECYMKEHGVSKQTAYEQFEKDITKAWNDINMESLLPTAVPMPLLTRVSNLARVINLLYDGEDGYKNSSTRTKDFIISVLVDSVPVPVLVDPVPVPVL